MKKFFFFLLSAVSFSSRGQVTLDSTNLPIVGIYTFFQQIPDTPKITAFMGIIDNGYNATNHVTDTNFTYYGYIGIEKRGNLTLLFPQASYGIETRDSLGNDSNVFLMSMPKESDWILNELWDDHTYMRNVLTYQLARQMGYWAPRTKYCELMLNTFINWNYKGVYAMMEKIKRDNDRVDISKLDSDDNAGDSLTGGYIIAVDNSTWQVDSGFYSKNDTDLFFAYKYPKGDEITPPQKAYIQLYVDSFETALLSPNFTNPVTGYRKYIEPVSFMDFFILQELSKNPDAYKRSSYLYKDKYSKGGKLHAGPHWDYNGAWDNAHIFNCDVDTGWVYPGPPCFPNPCCPISFWWSRLLQDSSYANDLKCRWMYLRSTVLDTVNIFHVIDSIAGYISIAQTRQHAQYNFTDNFQNQVDSLKWWINFRLAWMDAKMPGNCLNTGATEESTLENSFEIYPNPTSGIFNILMSGLENVQMKIYNIYGECIEQHICTSAHQQIDLSSHPDGIYVLNIKTEQESFTQKLIIQKK